MIGHTIHFIPFHRFRLEAVRNVFWVAGEVLEFNCASLVRFQLLRVNVGSPSTLLFRSVGRTFFSSEYFSELIREFSGYDTSS